MSISGGFIGLAFGTLAEIRDWSTRSFVWRLNTSALLLAGLAYVLNL